MWREPGPEHLTQGRRAWWTRCAPARATLLCHQGLTCVTALGIFHLAPVSTLHYPARCPSEADLWGLSHWASLSCGVQWVQPTRGFSGRSKRERHIWVSYVPSSLVYCRLFVSPHQWPRGSCHTALSQQLFSLSSSTYSPAFSPQAVQKGWQRIPTVASPRILQHPSLVSLMSAGTMTTISLLNSQLL